MNARKNDPDISLSKIREFRRMNKDELRGRLHDLQRSPRHDQLETARDIEVRAVLQELETYQIELEIQNRELRESQHALEESQDRYLNLYDFAPVGYLTLTDQGTMEELNLTAAGMFGVERSSLVGRSLAPWVSSVDVPILREHLKKCRNSGGKVTSVLRLLRRDKSSLPIELATIPWVDSGSGKTLLRSTLTDVSERLAMQESLEFEKNKLEAIFQSSPAAMMLLRGPDLIFDLVNPVYQAIFPDRELLGKNILEATPELKNQPFPNIVRSVFETGKRYRGQEMLARIATSLGGELEDHYYDISYEAVMGSDGQTYGVYNHAMDVTDRVLARKAIEKVQSDLQETVVNLEEEREIRERFVSALTHDLRTPLTAARMTAQLLARVTGDPEKVKRFSSRIVSAVDRLDRMIHDLLDANRLKAGAGLPISTQECRLDQAIDAVVQELRELHGPRFQFKNKMGALTGYWDANSIQRVVENLGNNAIKYGSPDTPISILLTEITKGWVDIAVHNEGRPIEPRDQATLFKPFGRTDSALKGGQKGWGIGLTLVKGIAEAHGGSVHVESSRSKGTTFHIRLPLDCRK